MTVAALESLFVPLPVTLEIHWVLRSRYRVEKAAVIQTFNRLLVAREIEFQEEVTLERAENLDLDHADDFSDCFHLAVAMMHEHLPMVTFERKAARFDRVLGHRSGQALASNPPAFQSGRA